MSTLNGKTAGITIVRVFRELTHLMYFSDHYLLLIYLAELHHTIRENVTHSLWHHVSGPSLVHATQVFRIYQCFQGSTLRSYALRHLLIL